MSSYSSITGHMSMVYDDVRNSSYAAALKKYVNGNTVVLDLGSGLGIHGLIAAAQGARKVYLVDPSPVNAVAAKIAAENGFSHKITCIQKKIEEAELPEKVDIIVSVFTGNFLLEEDLLPSLFFARDKHLNSSGVLLPDRAEMQAVPISAAEYHRKHVGTWSTPSQGISFSAVRPYAANTLCYDNKKSRKAVFLAKPAKLLRLDFSTAAKAECDSHVTFEATKSGDCHGFLGWFRMRLGGKWLSTSPRKPAMHWSQVFLPLDVPIQVSKGEVISFRLQRPQFGEWTWTCTHSGVAQRHSTFLSRVLAHQDLRHLAQGHRIELNARGELTKFMINQMNGINSVETIRQRAMIAYASRFASAHELNRAIDAIISGCGR